jgi:hypothetical protein
VKVSRVFFAIGAHNGKGESFLRIVESTNKKRLALFSNSAKGICIVQYNFMNMSCEEFHTYIRGVPAPMKKTGSTEKYACG